MSFAVIDLDGSTLGTFDDLRDLRVFLRSELTADASASAELSVLEYRDGVRVGKPRSAGDVMIAAFMPRIHVIDADDRPNEPPRQVSYVQIKRAQPISAQGLSGLSRRSLIRRGRGREVAA
jgi:hypothetical protein